MSAPTPDGLIDSRRLARWTGGAALAALGPGMALLMTDTLANGGLALMSLGLLLSIFAVAFHS